MRFVPALAFALLLGCGVEPAGPQVGVTRQANLTLDPVPTVVGRALGAKLGTSLAPCRAGGYVAGAPGKNELFFSPTGFLSGPPLMLSDLGVAVACDGDSSATPLAGSRFGYYGFQGTSPLPRQSGSVSAIARPTTSSLPVLVMIEGRLYTDTGAASLRSWPGITGQSVVWFPEGRTFAVGSPQLQRVDLYKWELDGGITVVPNGTLTPPMGASIADFGAVLAAGDVFPRPGPELIVGAPGANRVHVYSGATQVLVLSARDNLYSEFGAALAVDPTDAGGGLSALWVGDPQRSEVNRYVGTSRETVGGGALLPQRFGASLAIDHNGDVTVGAPLFNDIANNRPNAGALYGITFSGPYLDAVAQECGPDPDPCPLPNCQVGICRGGVLCERSAAQSVCGIGTSCDPNSNTCVTPNRDGGVDAGAPDGGQPDAGEGEPDAGTPDAGPPDAGGDGVDAGPGTLEPLQFRACSCGSAGPVLAALALGVLARRRRP